MKKKTYILMLSKVFPVTHPRAGQPTGFKEKKEKGIKKHTLRMNVELWEHRAEEINAGRAILSIRQWSGTPYEEGSHQIEIVRLEKLGVQRVTFSYCHYKKGNIYLPQLVEVGSGMYHPKVIEMEQVAANDGLSLDDFKYWFGRKGKSRPKDLHGIILHFTDFRY